MSLTCLKLKEISADTPWTCYRYIILLLPFHAGPDVDESLQENHDENLSDEKQDILNTRHNRLKLMRLNAQSMTSTFNEFLFTMKASLWMLLFSVKHG